MITFAYPRNFTGGRCDFYLKIKRCLTQHNYKNFWSIFTVWKGKEIRIKFCDPRNFTGGRCDFYLKIERCLK